MGLHNVSKPGSGRSAEFLRRAGHWLVPAVITVIAIVIAAFGSAGTELLKYDRLAIADGGEYWRLLSGHFAHLGPEHLLLNIAGLVLVWLLVGRQYTTAQWLIVTVFSLVVISLGFWTLDPNLLWYVGLSGLLHGLLIAGATGSVRTQTVESIIIIVAVAGKLAYEQVLGPLPGSEATAGGTVITNAHLFGAFGGAMVAALLWRRDKPAASI